MPEPRSVPIAATTTLFVENNASDLKFANGRWSSLKLKNLGLLSPAGILALDVDETILRWKDQSILHKERLQKIIKKARDNHILVVAVTARQRSIFETDIKYSSQFPRVKPVHQVLYEIDPEGFSHIFFTESKEKQPVLEMLRKQLIQNRYNIGANKICLVDDQPFYLAPCAQSGFVTILADQKKDYVSQMERFINEVIVRDKVDEALSNVRNKSVDEKVGFIYEFYLGHNINLLQLVKEILLVTPSEAEKAELIAKINRNLPNLPMPLLDAAIKESDIEMLVRIFPNLQPDEMNDVIFKAVNYEKTRPEILLWMLGKIKEKRVILTKSVELLTKAVQTNQSLKAEHIVDYLKVNRLEDELKAAPAYGDSVKRLHLNYEIREFIKRQKELSNDWWYSPWATSRMEKIIAAEHLLDCLRNRTPYVDMRDYDAFLTSIKLNALYHKVSAVLSPPRASLNDEKQVAAAAPKPK